MLFRLIFLLVASALVMLAASFILSLLSKWGIIEWMQVHAPTELIYKWASCKFCLSFWVSLFLAIIATFVFGRAELLLAPVLVTSILKELW